ncbi:hypothetical protein BCR44DRAFT_33953 [Catenaria anguillulae PL171]|uniref:Uncharacterized protein n=1 Tax=Catenaria anguillulae PL171 TaxID=765915 RepID=A0A1Y2HHF9_9FUNG|nr:hypothetical protein BCR44DRAFT_33953 [Catenaria anguillulae PL171]
MPSMPNDTDDARDSERGNQYDNHAQQKRSTRLPPPTFALTLSAGDSPDSADRVASQPGVFGGSHLSPLVETTAAQLEANLPTDDNEPTSSHSLLDYASASASNNDFLQDQPYGYTGATQLVSSKDSLNVWIVPPRHNTSVDAIPKYPSAETIKSTTNRQTPVLGESGMRLSGGELVSAASKSTYASIPDSSSTPISSSGQGSGHVIHSFTTSQSGFNHGFGSGHLSTAPVSAKRRRSTVTFSLNAEPFEVDPYFFMENAEQDSGPPPILPPWISPPRPILRRHSHMPTAVPSSQPTSTETSDSSHSFTGQLCMNANGPSSALSVIKTTSQPSTAVTRLPGSESPSAASIAIPRHRHTYAWSTAGLLSRVVEPVCSSMTAYMANPQSRVWQFLNYLKRSLDIFYLLSVPVSIAFICEVTFGFFHLFAAADLLLYVAVLLDMLRPRRNAYGVFPTDPVEQHHLYWRSTRNRLKLLACVPLDWALFFLRLSRGSWDEGYMCQHHIHVFFGSDGSSSLTPPDSTSGVTLLGSSARFLYSNRYVRRCIDFLRHFSLQ